MNESQPNADIARIAALLAEIREAQGRQLEQSREALQLQREQFEFMRRQAERTERIQDRAEQIQDRSFQIVGLSRKLMLAVLPIVIGLIAYLTWLLFRR